MNINISPEDINLIRKDKLQGAKSFNHKNMWNSSNPKFDSPGRQGKSREGSEINPGIKRLEKKIRHSEPREMKREERDRDGSSSDLRGSSSSRKLSSSKSSRSRSRSRDRRRRLGTSPRDSRRRYHRSRSRDRRSRSRSRDRKRRKEEPRSIKVEVGKEDKDNLMLHFYEGDQCDFEDPGDPDILEILPTPVPGLASRNPEKDKKLKLGTEREATAHPVVAPSCSEETSVKVRAPVTSSLEGVKPMLNINLDEIPEPQFPKPVPVNNKVTACSPLRINPKENSSF